MQNLNLATIQRLIDESLTLTTTGDPWLDNRYQEQVRYIAHVNPYYRTFFLLARELHPTLSVELGSWQATTAAHLAVGWPEGQVITIDHHREDLDAKIKTQEAAARYGNLHYLCGWTWDVVGQVRPLAPIDILFIDAWHQPEYLARDWALFHPLLADEALVIVDDVFESGPCVEGVVDFWSKLEGEKLLDSRIHPDIPMGFCIWRRKPVEPVAESEVQPAPAKRGRKKRS
jgi:predicted O-methyltransferase YrrM